MAYATEGMFSPDGREQRRSSKRISATLNYAAYQALEKRSTQESRSISNLAAHLIESALKRQRERSN
jgi:hypothetical protein